MVLLIDNDDVEALVRPGPLLNAIEVAYRDFARGRGVSAPRQDLQAEPAGDETYQLGLTAGIAGDYGCVRIKSDMTYLVQGRDGPQKEKYAVRPGVYCGLLLLFSVRDGAPLAMIRDGALQRLRVGADSAIGARLLARPESRVLGILGAGGMAAAHLAMMQAVLPIRRLVVYSPTPANRAALARRARHEGLEAEAAEDAGAVAAQADVLCACTSATGPVILGRDLRPGTHVTAIGGRLDREASDRVDRWLRLGLASAAPEWGGQPIEEECLTFSASGGKSASGGTRRFADIPAERRILLADLLQGQAPGRQEPEEITFSDRGNLHGLQFAAAAAHVYECARQAGRGRDLPLEDFTQTIRN
jgi:ornithine cyclodeaminase/alanine dehydrogenase-like protein (mu-crystallin family)